MFAVVLWIVVEAVERFSSPVPVNGSSVFLVATLGLLINIAVAWTLSEIKKHQYSRCASACDGRLAGFRRCDHRRYCDLLRRSCDCRPDPVYFCECFNPAFFLGRRQNFSTSSLDGVPENIPYQEVGSTLKQFLAFTPCMISIFGT